MMPVEIRRKLFSLRDRAFETPEKRAVLIILFGWGLFMHSLQVADETGITLSANIEINDALEPYLGLFEQEPEIHQLYLDVLSWLADERSKIFEELSEKLVPELSGRKGPQWSFTPTRWVKK